MNKMIKRLEDWIPSCIAVLICVLCFGTRVYNVQDIVFPEGHEPLLIGADPYFYLRHVETTLKNYPRLQKFDHAAHYPEGMRADAASLYVLALATICKMVGVADPDSQHVAGIISWVPPLLGALSCFLIFLIGSALRGKNCGLLGAGLFLLYPGLGLPRSALGFVDHHVAEIFLCLWIIYGLIRLMQAETKSLNLWAPFYALPTALIFFVWPGSPLYLIMIGIALFLYYSFNNLSKVGIRMQFYNLGLYFSSIILILGLSRWFHPDLWTVLNPRHQLLVILGFAFLGAGLPLFSLTRRKLNSWINLPSKLTTYILFFLVASAVFGILFFTEDGKLIRFYLHFKGLGLTESRIVDLPWFLYTASVSGILASLAMVYYLIRYLVWSPEDHTILIVPFLFIFLYMWVSTYDMGYMLGSLMAILSAGFLTDIYKNSRSWVKKYGLRKSSDNSSIRSSTSTSYLVFGHELISWVGVIAIVLVPILQPFSTQPFWLTKKYIQSSVIYYPAILGGMDWIRTHTPALPLPIDRIIPPTRLDDANSPEQKNYGIITAWDYGNIVNQRGHRIPVWSRYPAGPQSKWMVARSEEESMQHLCPACDSSEYIKYAIVDSKMAGPYFLAKTKLAGIYKHSLQQMETIETGGIETRIITFGADYEESMIARLFKYDGYNLSHYRLIWDSPEYVFLSYMISNNRLMLADRDINTNEQYQFYMDIHNAGYYAANGNTLYKPVISPKVKVFEIVKGTIIQGRVLPKSQVQVSLRLRSDQSQREWNFARNEISDENGDFKLTFPYSTEFNISRSGIIPENSCILKYQNEQNQEMQMKFSVAEIDVQDGNVIDLGVLSL